MVLPPPGVLDEDYARRDIVPPRFRVDRGELPGNAEILSDCIDTVKRRCLAPIFVVLFYADGKLRMLRSSSLLELMIFAYSAKIGASTQNMGGGDYIRAHNANIHIFC